MKFDRDAIANLMPRQQADGWYVILTNKAKASTTAEVRIYDYIGLWGMTAEDLVRDLDELDVDDITCKINCPGGSVFDGIAIHNALAAHSARVTTMVEGVAASAASFIVQAGDHRVMMRHAQMMVHNASGVAFGDADTMRDMADLLDKQNGIIAGIYAERSGDDDQDEAYFLDMMAATTWMTDQEAVDNGLADEVVTPPRQEPDNALAATKAPDGVSSGAIPPVDVDWAKLFADAMTKQES